MNQDSMNQDIREQLSALIDNELDRDRMRFLLKRAEHDAELVALWQRWHFVGEAMRGSALPLRRDFMRGIAARLEQDESESNTAPAPATTASRAPRLLRWSGGAALAASVALAALIFAQPDGKLPGVSDSGAEQAQELALQQPAPAVVAPSPYREQDLRPPYRFDAQTVVSRDRGRWSEQLHFNPDYEAHWLRQQQALPLHSMPLEVWNAPLRPQPQPSSN